MTTEQCLWCPWRSLNKWDCNKQQFAQELLECPDRPKLLIAVGHFSHINFDHERYPDQSEYLDLSPIKRSVARCHELMNVWRYEEWAGNLRMSRATGTVPERVQSRVHTTEPTGPVPEPFHCDHIARWSARSGTTGRSGTGVNTGARLRSGTVPVPNVWCEHGLRLGSAANYCWRSSLCLITTLSKAMYAIFPISRAARISGSNSFLLFTIRIEKSSFMYTPEAL